jgi:hypothetical protein
MLALRARDPPKKEDRAKDFRRVRLPRNEMDPATGAMEFNLG